MITRIVVMTVVIMVFVTTKITRIVQAFMSASRREILGSRGRSKSQPLVTIPRNECDQGRYDRNNPGRRS
jgi:hypothetical protein